MNPAAIRAGLLFADRRRRGAGQVTYGEVFTVQPFGNIARRQDLHRRADQGRARAAVQRRAARAASDPPGLGRASRYSLRLDAQPAGNRVDAASQLERHADRPGDDLPGDDEQLPRRRRRRLHRLRASARSRSAARSTSTHWSGTSQEHSPVAAGPAEPHHHSCGLQPLRETAAARPALDQRGIRARESPAILQRSDEQQRTRNPDAGRGRRLDDRPRRGADPRLRGHLPDDQRGRGRPRHRRARRQGRGARRHRLQVRRGHPRRRAVDPAQREPRRRGVGRGRDRRARDDEGGRRGAPPALEEARPLRARLEGDRGARPRAASPSTAR